MISTFLACNAAAQLPIEKTAPTFEEVLNGFSNADSDSVRIGVIRDLGETIGFRGGMSAESQKNRQFSQTEGKRVRPPIPIWTIYYFR